MTDGKYELMTCAALAAGLMFCSGCVIVVPDSPDTGAADTLQTGASAAGTLMSHDVTLDVRSVSAPTNSVSSHRLTQRMFLTLQEQFRSRGLRVMPSGGTHVELNVSLQKIMLYDDPELTWHTYVVMSDARVTTKDKPEEKCSFVVDGRELEGRRYSVLEREALAPVEAELMKQIDAWLSAVLKCKTDTAQ